MTLPSSGAISISAINAEFGRGNNLNAYRGTTWYTDAGGSGTFSSGALAMSDFYGKRSTSPTFSATISSNQSNLNLRSWALSNGWNGSSAAIITVGSGVYIYSTSTGTAGMTIDGSWPNGITLINNGYIMGMGGAGGNGSNSGSAGSAGGSAISLGVSCSIKNNSYIGGGGGGGGGGYWVEGCGGGGGAGGGSGGNVYRISPAGFAGAGAGGGLGGSGSNGASIQVTYNKTNPYSGAGGGGGRVFPGTGGAGGPSNGGAGSSTGGGGGGSAGGGGGGMVFGAGGAGGSGGSAGTTISQSSGTACTGAGGGGWGASGGSTYWRAAGAGGKCVALNGYSVTWIATGTRYGAIS